MCIVVYTYSRVSTGEILPVWHQYMIDHDGWYTFYEWGGYWYEQLRAW